LAISFAAVVLRSIEGQLQDAPSNRRCSSFAFPGWGGSAYVPAIQDQTDVGISGTLHPGLGFFGHLHAAPALLPCG